jgi:hypothetical protein
VEGGLLSNSSVKYFLTVSLAKGVRGSSIDGRLGVRCVFSGNDRFGVDAALHFIDEVIENVDVEE